MRKNHSVRSPVVPLFGPLAGASLGDHRGANDMMTDGTTTSTLSTFIRALPQRVPRAAKDSSTTRNSIGSLGVAAKQALAATQLRIE